MTSHTSYSDRLASIERRVENLEEVNRRANKRAIEKELARIQQEKLNTVPEVVMADLLQELVHTISRINARTKYHFPDPADK